MVKRLKGLIVLLGIATYSIAQTTDSIRVQNTYIQKYNDILNVKLSLNNFTDYYALNDGNTNYTIKPNTNLTTKLWLNYRVLSVGISKSFDVLPFNSDAEEKGKSKNFQFNIHLLPGNFIQHLTFHRTKGFYISESSDSNYDPDTDEYLRVPDLKVWGIKGHTAYKFNRNYSTRNLLNQTEVQVKSAGTFIPSLSYHYYQFRNDYKLDSITHMSSPESDMFEISLHLGYFYTYVFNQNFYINGGAAVGGGYNFTFGNIRFYDGNESHFKQENPLFRTEWQVGLGYNQKLFFCGGNVTGSWHTYKQNGTNVKNIYRDVTVQVFLGYRFAAPKFLQSTYDKVVPF